MTVIPAQLVADDETKAILLTLEEFRHHDLTLEEAQSDLALLADGHADEALAGKLADYLDGMLHRVASDEISSDTAARDIQCVITAVTSHDPDAALLEELGAE
jgi:hypothetical protein